MSDTVYKCIHNEIFPAIYKSFLQSCRVAFYLQLIFVFTFLEIKSRAHARVCMCLCNINKQQNIVRYES